MRLLIITQKVDEADSNLGFFIRWIEEFAKHCELVTVICLEKGEYKLSDNVRVFSLGKEERNFQFSRLPIGGQAIFNFQSIRNFIIFKKQKYLYRFLKYIWKERKNYDAVFVHMNPEYAILGGLLWMALGKKIALWYTHKEVSLRLRLSAKLVDKIFTASKESCRLRNKKVEAIGHGIDTELFKSRKTETDDLHLVTVGRISPVKDLNTLIRGFLELRKRFPSAEFSIVGEPITNLDREYFAELRYDFSDQVRFLGKISHNELPELYSKSTVFVHSSKTGSMDKAVLEALAVGLPVFTSSEAFSQDIPGIVKFEDGNAADLAGKISRAFAFGKMVIPCNGSFYVKERHSLSSLVKKIISFYG